MDSFGRSSEPCSAGAAWGRALALSMPNRISVIKVESVRPALSKTSFERVGCLMFDVRALRWSRARQTRSPCARWLSKIDLVGAQAAGRLQLRVFATAIAAASKRTNKQQVARKASKTWCWCQPARPDQTKAKPKPSSSSKPKHSATFEKKERSSTASTECVGRSREARLASWVGHAPRSLHQRLCLVPCQGPCFGQSIDWVSFDSRWQSKQETRWSRAPSHHHHISLEQSAHCVSHVPFRRNTRRAAVYGVTPWLPAWRPFVRACVVVVVSPMCVYESRCVLSISSPAWSTSEQRSKCEHTNLSTKASTDTNTSNRTSRSKQRRIPTAAARVGLLVPASRTQDAPSFFAFALTTSSCFDGSVQIHSERVTTRTYKRRVTFDTRTRASLARERVDSSNRRAETPPRPSVLMDLDVFVLVVMSLSS